MPSTFNSKECGKRRRSSRLSTIKRTKENIVIFKVFANYLDKNISKQTLIRQFESFGKIKDLNIVERQNRANICKVTYYDPESAAHLLRTRSIRLNQSRIMIQPCPTWEQPLQVTSYNQNTISNESSELTLNSPQPLCDILSLNDYCLEIIFNYLDLKSQLRFSFCHERLEQVYIYMICPRTMSKPLNVGNLCDGRFSNWEIWQFFKTAGQYIKKIKFWSPFRLSGFKATECDALEMIEEFSTNVESIQLVQRYLRINFLDYFNINLITEIELYSCGIVDPDLKILVQCRNLTSLGLAKNPQLTGALLPRFEKLKHLSLHNCHQIKFEYLLEACEKLSLEYLNIINVNNLNRAPELFNHCPKLNTLKMNIDSASSLEQTMVLENLKSVELHMSLVNYSLEKYNASLEILKIFDFHNSVIPTDIGKFSSLRTLWLCSDFDACIGSQVIKSISTLKELEEFYVKTGTMFSDIDFLPLVKNCLKLKRLCITDCKQLRKNFITLCYGILENRKYNSPTTSSAVTSQKPLTIFLNHTGIKTNFIKNFNTCSNNKLLVVKQFSREPLIGFLNDDLTFNAPPKDSAEEDDSDDSSDEDDSDDEYDDFYMEDSDSDSDDGYYLNGYFCNLM